MMRAAKPLVLGIGAIAIAAATYVHTVWNRGLAVEPGPEVAEGGFDRLQSAGLFVGVREFKQASMMEVPYAVDDAVDLAYMFTIDDRASLLPPRNIVLALAGDPQKEDSRRKLRDLRKAGATVREATAEDILTLLERQSEAVGKNGILLFSVATHGFVDARERKAYILGSNSRFEHTRTALPLEVLIEIAAQSNAQRSLLFLDACRNRFRDGIRGAGADPRSKASPLDELLGKIHGQVVFYAAPAGEYAYDDQVRKNGVFTRAVLDGLSCDAGTVTGGLVTAEKLREYVDRNVLKWVRKHEDPTRKAGIQANIDGRAENMPLAVCSCPPCVPRGPNDVRWSGVQLTAIDDHGKGSWKASVNGEIAEARVQDLDADHTREVIVRVAGKGADSGKVVLFDALGNRKWAAGAGIHQMTLGEFKKYKHHIVALSRSLGVTRLTLIDSSGNVVQPFETLEKLNRVLVGRPTNAHDARILLASSQRLYLIDPPPEFNGRRFNAELLEVFNSIRDIRIVSRGRTRQVEVTSTDTTTYLPFAEAPGELKPQKSNFKKK